MASGTGVLTKSELSATLCQLMLMMRLQRVGRKNNPSYRIVVVDKRTSVKSNKTTDLIGTYNPKAGEIIINADKAKHWLAHGVQPSDTVYNMLVSKKIIEGKKRNNLPKKSPIIDEAKVKAEAEAKAAAEAAEAEAKAAAEAPAEAETPTEEVVEAPAETEEVKA
ncbi:MAG: 30S ribosomal protein S16 [Candidatus Paceibacteria bacterium]